MPSKVTLHMVSSLDGFVAKKDNNIEWLQSTDYFESGIVLSDEAVSQFIAGIDCYLMGSKTYEQALNLGWPYAEKPVVVFSRHSRITEKENVKFLSGDLREQVNSLKQAYPNIWLVGGPSLVKDFMKLQLIDEIVLSIMPIILGDGLLFFDFVGQEQPLHLKEVTAFQDGMVELSYEVKKEINP